MARFHSMLQSDFEGVNGTQPTAYLRLPQPTLALKHANRDAAKTKATIRLTQKCRNSDRTTPRVFSHLHRYTIKIEVTHGTAIKLNQGLREATNNGEGATKALSDPRMNATGT